MKSHEVENDSQEILLKITDVEKILNVCRAQVYRLITSHGLPTIKLGRSRRVSRKALYRWIEEQDSHEK